MRSTTPVVLGVNDSGLNDSHKLFPTQAVPQIVLRRWQKFYMKLLKLNLVLSIQSTLTQMIQRLADVPHSDWRRSRAAAENVIPTTTGAARAVGKVLPELNGKLDGIAMRVPVPDGSVVDFNVRIKKTATVDEVNEVVYAASKTGSLSNVLEYSTLPVVSSDIIGNKYSSIFDAPFTKVIGGNYIKTLNWYDNEWGYSNRVVDVMSLIANFT